MGQQKYLQKLFEKEMNRRQFLFHIGTGILAIIGVSGLLKHLVDFSSRPRHEQADDYTSPNYGNKK